MKPLYSSKLAKINKIVKKFKRPDAIYSNILQFYHPGSKTIFDSGSVNFIESCAFSKHVNEPFKMTEIQKSDVIAASLNFDRPFYFATQPLVFRKDFSDHMNSDGKPFKSKFPDYFFSNFVFIKSKNLVINPSPITFQGISIKSFGSNMMHDKMAEGFKNLNLDKYSLHPFLVEYLKECPILLQNSYQLGVADAIIHTLAESKDFDRFNLNKFKFAYFHEYFLFNRDKVKFIRILIKFLLKGLFSDLFICFLSYYKHIFESKYFAIIISRYRIKNTSIYRTLDRGSFTSNFEIYNEFKVAKNML